MKVTEQNFVKQMILKNEKALEYCMMNYGGLVKAVIHRQLGNLVQYEEECLNDVFLAVWQHVDSYQADKSSFANWIAGVARLKALDCRRKYVKQLMEHGWEDSLDSEQMKQMPEMLIVEREISEETEKMLGCLKPSDRELFWKLYVEEEDLETVVKSTGMSKSMIYNHISRGKKKIRNLHEAKRMKGEQV